MGPATHEPLSVVAALLNVFFLGTPLGHPAHTSWLYAPCPEKVTSLLTYSTRGRGRETDLGAFFCASRGMAYMALEALGYDIYLGMGLTRQMPIVMDLGL